MRHFDFNLHLPSETFSDVNDTIFSEKTVSADEMGKIFSGRIAESNADIAGANVMVLNPDLLFDKDETDKLVTTIRGIKKETRFTLMVDFRKKEVIEAVDRGAASRINGIKFHSYIQEITRNDFSSVISVCRHAAAKGLWICIDTSYGTTKMFKQDNLKLAAEIADAVDNVPVILLHSGGARVIEAMLLADDKKNIMLETSFSLPFYQGSSLEMDMAFAYKKLGSEKILYGSDAPYVPINKAMRSTLAFLEKYRFSADEIENILLNNALGRLVC